MPAAPADPYLSSPVPHRLEISNRTGALSPRLLRTAVGGVLGFATLVAVLLTLDGGPRLPLLILGTFWAVLGMTAAIFNAIDTVPDAVARLLINAGVADAPGFSDIDAMIAQGHYAAAAELCRMRGAHPASRIEATLRRADLLATRLDDPRAAAAELARARDGNIPPRDRVRVGLALADVYAGPLADPERACRQLEDLARRFPDVAGTGAIPARLAALRAARPSDGGGP